MGTHEVLNQPPPLVDYDAAAIDVPLTEGLARLDPDADPDLAELGRRAGSAEVQHWAPGQHVTPTLRTHDRYGNRIDEVEFHPAWHQLMERRVGPRAARRAVGRRRPVRPPAPGGGLLRLDPGRGRATSARSR